jgi:8-oxo-dGTP pyrophosphatase MutT (NUDIX family)
MSDLLLTAQTPLRACDAVAALLVLEDGRYVMQLRDARPDIFFPGHWGCFGGAVDGSESPLAALKRELREELELEIGPATEFIRFDFDFSHLGQSKVYRAYYEVPLSAAAFSRLVLHEGAAMEAIEGGELLLRRRLTPYDAFAVWAHMQRNRFLPARAATR